MPLYEKIEPEVPDIETEPPPRSSRTWTADDTLLGTFSVAAGILNAACMTF